MTSPSIQRFYHQILRRYTFLATKLYQLEKVMQLQRHGKSNDALNLYAEIVEEFKNLSK